jgi:glutathione synthase/RimK-type ligase-like ATP-grasp enzyme
MPGFATKQNVSNSLKTNHELTWNVPDTRLFSRLTLKRMLGRYKMLYVKPNNGTGGKGVMRVEKPGPGRYIYQLQTTVRTFNTFDRLVDSIKKKTSSTPYIIQRGIHLLRYNKRRFDLRVMVQKNPKGKWETTGVIGRLGHPKEIVTNVCKGGSSMPIEVLLKKYVPSIDGYKSRLERLGKRAAQRLNKTFPKIKELGLDIGIDKNAHPWILEANPRPAIYGFKTLKDKRIYQKICRYQKAYVRR